jgi:DNA-binding GntR family transcriptional regulator
MKIMTAVDMAKQFLEEGILSGQLKPGQQIKEETVSAQLDISRPPIREALKALEVEGLITRVPRRGVFVSELTRQDIWEIYTLKMILYKMATDMAFDKFTGLDIRELERVVEKMEDCILRVPGNLRRYQKLNELFHDIITRVAGHQRLKRFASILHNQIKPFSCQSLADKDHMKASCRYHRRILDAIKSGDREQAVGLTREHVAAGLHFFNGWVFNGRDPFQSPPGT